MFDFNKFILSKYPNADLDRYRFKEGDIFKVGDAVLLCLYSAVEYVNCYVIKRSLQYREPGVETRVYYEDIPREPVFVKPKLRKSGKWKVGDIVETDGMLIYLYKEEHPQYFYAWVIESENNYYLHTGIALPSPLYYYVSQEE